MPQPMRTADSGSDHPALHAHSLSESWPVVGLINVSEPYSDHIAARARQAGMRTLCLRDGTLPPDRVRQMRLCVAQIDGHEDAGAGPGSIAALGPLMGSVPVVVLGEAVSIETVMRLTRMGAADVIEIPASITEVADRALSRLAARESSDEPREVVGESPQMATLRSDIARVARTDSTVLITGETGTGKGLVARAIHRLSRRREKPFVHVDCTGLSATVIESEFFGHERGAFTGAVGRREGRFEVAREGTIFLDEIGDFDPSLQSKLLRVLQDREYERVGGSRTLPMTARVVAATNQELERAVAENRFRADLFFRLNVVHLRLPPLREHIGDLPELVSWGFRQLANRLGLPVPAVNDLFLAKLMSHSWPGNVRELLNVLERTMVQRGALGDASSELDRILDGQAAQVSGLRHPGVARELAAPRPLEAEGEGSERRRIASALIATGGNIARAARRLGMPRSTLRYRVRVQGLGSLIPKD
jgi:DNA-binding NtrC family response regulator